MAEAPADTKRISSPVKGLVAGEFFTAYQEKEKILPGAQRDYKEPRGTGSLGDRAEAIMTGQTKEGVQHRLALSMKNVDGKDPVLSATVQKGNARFMAEYQLEASEDGRAKIKMEGGQPVVKYFAVNADNTRSDVALPKGEAALVAGHFRSLTDTLKEKPFLQTNSFMEDSKLKVGYLDVARPAIKAPRP